MSSPLSKPLQRPGALLPTVRKPIRDAWFRFVRRTFEANDGRAILADSLRGLTHSGPPFVPDDPMKTHRVYPELGVPRSTEPALPIIITGRFRSGSTLLWNVFRQIDGCTAYYEPFNERRWFDPASRGRHTDGTHLGVSNYWQEYEGLGELADHYRESWIDRHLYMDATAWDPAMKRYVSILIESAPARPVLQFNRIDLRLPWFRSNFRTAVFVHLYRNPRDQWCSSLVDPRSFSKDAHIADFRAHDHFYLQAWADDLEPRFPFLDKRAVSHPYQLFYYLWKLSYLFGAHYAHYSLAFEDLVRSPERELRALMRAVDVDDYSLARVSQCVKDQRLGKWRDYAGDAWFRRHESACETVLGEYLGSFLPTELGGALRPFRREPLEAATRGI